MITRGSKFFLAAAGVSYLVALLYGFVTSASDQAGVFGVFSEGGVIDAFVGPLSFGWKGGVGEHVGYATLLGAAAVFATLGGFTTAFRDGSVEAVAQITPSGEAGPVAVPRGLSYWPVLTAFAVAVALVGLAVNTAFFVLGAVLVVVAGFSWTVRTWAERAAADQSASVELRHTMLDPLEIPVLSIVAMGVIAVSIAQILLAIPISAATYVIIVLATIVFVLAVLLANRPHLKRSLLVGILVGGGLLLILGGIVGGIVGSSHGGHSEEGRGGSPIPAVVGDTGPTAGSTGF